MKQLTIILFLFLLTTSFIQSKEEVSIIFLNKTNKNFRIFKVNVLGKELVFRDLKSGSQTDTIFVPRACRYCYAEAITNNDTLFCRPEDYVGETVYTNGKILMIISSYDEKELQKNIDVSGTWDARKFILTKNNH
jgi:hypothetical protein